MAVFTDEQINEILNIFRQNMGHRQYIGARYVPIFGRVGETSIEWDNSAPYEPLTIVLHQGNSFTSRQYVPTGIDIDNTEFWVETGNFNAQIELYRQEVLEFSGQVSDILNEVNEISEELESSFLFETGTYENAIYSIVTFPKDKYRMDLKLADPDQVKTQGVALQSGKTIPEVAQEQNDSFISNVNPAQTVIYDGILYGEDWTATPGTTGTGFFGTTEDGEPVFRRGGTFSDMVGIANSAIGTWQPIITNGVNEQINLETEALANPNPFPMLAWDAENYYLMDVYGRFTDKNGLTAAELQAFANSRNWANAIIFDGGGSTCLCTTNPYKINSICLSSSHTWRTQYMYLAINERN